MQMLQRQIDQRVFLIRHLLAHFRRLMIHLVLRLRHFQRSCFYSR